MMTILANIVIMQPTFIKQPSNLPMLYIKNGNGEGKIFLSSYIAINIFQSPLVFFNFAMTFKYKFIAIALNSK